MELISFKRKLFVLLLSIIVHFLVLIIFSVIDYFLIIEESSGTNYLSLTLENNFKAELNNKYPIEQKIRVEKEEHNRNFEDKLKSLNSLILNDIMAHKIDSTALDSMYIDDTRGISIKYPLGWIFLDQKINSKFDGVTFWSPNEKSENVPFVHLEVAEKDLFDRRKYEFSVNQKDVIWHFNSPEIIDDYVNFLIYIKTQGDVDYKIKLIVKGIENFNSIKPKFLAMLNSLQFKKNYFEIFN